MTSSNKYREEHTSLTVHIRTENADKLRALADAQGLSMNQYLKYLIFLSIEPEGPKKGQKIAGWVWGR